MTVFTSKTEYLDGFQKKFAESHRANGALAAYVEKQLALLDELVAAISPETFWGHRRQTGLSHRNDAIRRFFRQ